MAVLAAVVTFWSELLWEWDRIACKSSASSCMFNSKSIFDKSFNFRCWEFALVETAFFFPFRAKGLAVIKLGSYLMFEHGLQLKYYYILYIVYHYYCILYLCRCSIVVQGKKLNVSANHILWSASSCGAYLAMTLLRLNWSYSLKSTAGLNIISFPSSSCKSWEYKQYD